MLFSSSPTAWRFLSEVEQHTLVGRKMKPIIDFLLIISGSSISCGRVPTTTTRSRNIAAMLQLINWFKARCSLVLQRKSLILDIHAMSNWHQLKQDSRDHIAGSSLELNEATFFLRVLVPRYWCSIGSQVQVRSFYLKNKSSAFSLGWIYILRKEIPNQSTWHIIL